MAFLNQTIPPVNSNFNTGRDRTWIIVDETTNQPVIPSAKVLEIVSKSENTQIKISPINVATTIAKEIYHGWSGTITIAREDGNWDMFQGAEESRYYGNQPQRYYSIFETTQNQNGTVNSSVYSHATIKLDHAGTWRKESDVPITLTVSAQRRIVLS